MPGRRWRPFQIRYYANPLRIDLGRLDDDPQSSRPPGRWRFPKLAPICGARWSVMIVATVISLYRPCLIDRVAAGGVLRRRSGSAAKAPLVSGLTEYQIHAVPDGILTTDIAGLVRDPSVDGRNRLRSNAYCNVLFQSRSSLLPNGILAAPALKTSLRRIAPLRLACGKTKVTHCSQGHSLDKSSKP
ncbi:hypothetical protein SAMN04488059_1456 [Devosia psychrophila]|uniref:Uncharacterized protein n=1 Tax=Devosia psychrophila TaxID=728005 RepID=A0A1I1RNA9_9HYPH|nr:hypothetical protein SAMN04488059_1456 [Devosia psychrophila]